ncbi:unnamed protein product [Protopolystoma xenopodis]|uniref:Uncharacterized protein n=1 Tax=Protopolystoma xenopodis TaxID=117903 RepID=A0A448WP84_9PLAT|nr:unnamed protein product [Protopolystoma xenopodis]
MGRKVPSAGNISKRSDGRNCENSKERSNTSLNYAVARPDLRKRDQASYTGRPTTSSSISTDLVSEYQNQGKKIRALAIIRADQSLDFYGKNPPNAEGSQGTHGNIKYRIQEIKFHQEEH